MGRSHILLSIGCLLCYFGGGLALFIDAHLSRQWLATVTKADTILPNLSLALAFIVAVLASGFGAVFTAPFSWKIIFMESKRIAKITNKHERLLTLLGVAVVGSFMSIGLVAVYGIDIISTQAQVKNLYLAMTIVFSSDICFVLANILGFMALSARAQAMELTTTLSGGNRFQDTVNATARTVRK